MSADRLDLIEEMLRKDPSDVFLSYAAALEYIKRGNIDRGIQTLELILQRNPSYLAAYYQLGKLYEENNEIKKAVNTYKKGKEIAREQNDAKALGELTEALMLLDEDESDW